MERARTSERSLDQFSWRLDGEASGIPAGRRAFEGWLRRSSARDDDVHDLAVVFSELASNAVAGAANGTRAEVRATCDGIEVLLEITNQVDAAAEEVGRWDLEDPLRGGGRGLLIVRAYTDSMEVDTVDGAVRVRCARRLELGR